MLRSVATARPAEDEGASVTLDSGEAHVLTNEHVTTRSFRTAPLEGSDHAVVVADLVVR